MFVLAGNPVCVFRLQHISVWMNMSQVLSSHLWLTAAMLDSIALGQ